MSKMFYNYNNNIPSINPDFPDHPRYNSTALSCAGVDKITTVTGRTLGVKAKTGTKFNLYFKFKNILGDPDALDSESMHDFLSEGKLCCDVLNFAHEVVYTCEAILNEYINEAVVEIDTQKAKLKQGIYKLHLYRKTIPSECDLCDPDYTENVDDTIVPEEEIYTLFSEEDGILSLE